MNKKFIIGNNDEIKHIISLSNKIVSKSFIIYYSKNNLKYCRFCVSVSKKLGKANIRNLFKRRVKDILMKNSIDKSCDYVIILRNSILNKNYENIKIELLNVLKGE